MTLVADRTWIGRSRSLVTRTLSSGLLVVSLGAIASCDCESCKTPDSGDTKQKAPTTAPTLSAAAPDAVYVVRGKVLELPDPNNPVKEFRLHHEAIDNFKNGEGKVVGMSAMEMPFPVKDASLIAGLTVGDIVEVTFEDFYKPTRHYHVTKVTKLAADTVLEFREARPAT